MLRRSLAMFAALPLLMNFTATALADNHMPTPALVKQALEATKRNWVAFRNFDGKQLIYFTNLATWHCALKSVRYSYNGSDDWKTWPLPKCYEDAPYIVNPDTDKLYETFKPGTLKMVAVEVTLSDGHVMPVLSFQPCDVPGDVTCAKPAD